MILTFTRIRDRAYEGEKKMWGKGQRRRDGERGVGISGGDARYSNVESVSVPGRCAEERETGYGGEKVGEDTDRGCEKKHEKKRNKIRSRHPLRFRTERTSRGALCSRAKFRRGAGPHKFRATVLNGILRRTFARAHIFHLLRSP